MTASPPLLRTLAAAVALLLVAAVVAAARSDRTTTARAAGRPAPTAGPAPVEAEPPTSAGPPPTSAATTAPPTTAPPASPRWTLDPYRGLGAWIDVFDYDPAYGEGRPPTYGPEVVDALAGRGVRTLFLQGGRDDERTPGGLVPAEVMGPMLARAHERGLAVVAWYLPKFRDTDFDLDILVRLGSFEWQGHRFDGLAVDIEANQTEPDHATRSQRLVDLSRRLRAAAPGEVLGAIVVPPVLLEVINPGFWPGFPWAELAGAYDVWLPMSYWTFRTEASGYRDAHRYSVDNVGRLFANLGGPVPVHLVGGVGDRSTDADYPAFVQAVLDSGAVGASFYDTRTTSEAGWQALARWAASGRQAAP